MKNTLRAIARHLLLPLVTALPLLMLAVTVHAQTVINTIPYTITTAGSYVLNGNLSSTQTTGNLITVNASNVTIDFQGYYISGPTSVTNQTTNGVFAGGRNNITIQNGIIAYCYTGIKFGSTSDTQANTGHIVTSMRITRCFFEGVEFDDSHGSIISNCQITKIGGSSANITYTAGVNIFGTGVLVLNNLISDITDSTSATNAARGIYSGAGSFSKGNQISNAYFGVQYGKYQDNLTYNCTTAFNGGTDAGGNN